MAKTTNRKSKAISKSVSQSRKLAVNPKSKGKGTEQGKPQAALLSTPWTNYTGFLPMFYVINPKPEEIILPYERRQQIQLGRELFAKMPIVSAAIMNKAHVCVGNAWTPNFCGDIRKDADGKPLQADLDWIQSATNWLINDYYPNVNWMGSNYTFADTLVLTSKDCDVEGGSLMLYRNTKSGLPRVQLIPTDRIGSGDNGDKMEGGTYDGYKIYDGIIFNSDNQPVALNLMGETKEDDQQISLFNCQYIFEPVWDGYPHGQSKISNAITTLMDIRDINDLLKITVKNFSAKGIIHKNARGLAPKGKRVFGIETPNVPNPLAVGGEKQTKIFYESINRGGTEYISSTDGSEIIPFNFDRPSPNVEAFISRISAESISSMGWFQELVVPSSLSGTSTRLIQNQARKLVVWRQQTLKRRAKAIVQYGLATAMKLGLIPMTDNKTWLRWNFDMPAELTIDNGRDQTAEQEALKLGLTTKKAICAKHGINSDTVDEQTFKEITKIFKQAQMLAKEFNISEAEAREWLSKRDVDVIQPQPAKDDDSAPEDETPGQDDDDESQAGAIAQN